MRRSKRTDSAQRTLREKRRQYRKRWKAANMPIQYPVRLLTRRERQKRDEWRSRQYYGIKER